MRFQTAHPEWLWLLAALPFWMLRAAIGRVRRNRGWSALGMVGRPSGDGSYLWIAAAACIVLSLTQPRWGRSGRPPLPPGHDVVLAIDVSRSMAAMDAVPDRLGVAVEAARSFLATLGQVSGDRVAVVAFAGRGVLRCPLTANLGAVGETLGLLKAGTVRPGGTDLGAALDAALEAFDDLDRAGGRSVVLFSDGEDHDARWDASLTKARDQGVIVHTVAIGDDKTGHPVPGPGGEPIMFEGKSVLSKRSDGAMEAIAKAAGGAFVPLGLATTDLGQLYRSRIEPGASVLRASFVAPEPGERFGLFLLAAMGFAFAAGWSTRPRLSTAHRLGWAKSWSVTAATIFSIGAIPGDDPAAAIKAGRADYSLGRFSDALAAFRRASSLDPASAESRFDAGAALFQLGRFDEAIVAYQEARDLAVPSLRTKVDFALGNASLAAGDLPGAIARYDSCLGSAADAPGVDLDRIRSDAAVNKRFAEEQARRSVAPPDGGKNSNSPEARPRDRDPNADRDDASDHPENRGPGQGNRNPDKNSPSGEPPENRGQGAGGAGGSGAEASPPGSPQAQLAKAVDRVREARRSRIGESDLPDKPDHRKDW